MGIIERIGSLAGTELAKAADLAHETFQDRLGVHGHTGRALVESVAEMCRNHPNLVGIGVGLLVEQLLVGEKRVHDAKLRAQAEAGLHPGALAHETDIHGKPHGTLHAPHIALPHLEHHEIRLGRIRPMRIALEVFGALLALKVGVGFARAFGRKHKHHGEVWFAPASRIHMISGSLAAYYLASAIHSKNVSAWRNAAIFWFGTDAIKPLLRADRRWVRTAPPIAPSPAAGEGRAVPALTSEPAASPAATNGHAPPPAPEPAHEPAPAPAPAPAGGPDDPFALRPEGHA